jgi:hypothetical protein
LSTEDRRITANQDGGGAASARRYVRLAAALMVVTIFAGGFGEMYIPSKLIVGSDASATAAHLRESQPLFRAGFAAYLVEATCDIALAWLFFILLRPVHRDLALLTVFFGLVSTATFAAAEMVYFSSSLVLRDAAYLRSFTSDQQNTIALLAVKTYNLGAGVFMVFYGIAMVIRGVLMFRSGYLPKFLGALVAVAGLGFTTKAFLVVLAPRFASSLLLLPMFLAVVSMIVWFFSRGIDAAKWDESVRAAARV